MPAPARTIAEIDHDIDVGRRELRKRRRVNQMSSASWQRAWDLEPELRQRDRDLFAERMVAMDVRDAAAAAQARQSNRIRRRLAASGLYQ